MSFWPPTNRTGGGDGSLENPTFLSSSSSSSSVSKVWNLHRIGIAWTMQLEQTVQPAFSHWPPTSYDHMAPFFCEFTEDTSFGFLKVKSRFEPTRAYGASWDQWERRWSKLHSLDSKSAAIFPTHFCPVFGYQAVVVQPQATFLQWPAYHCPVNWHCQTPNCQSATKVWSSSSRRWSLLSSASPFLLFCVFKNQK